MKHKEDFVEERIIYMNQVRDLIYKRDIVCQECGDTQKLEVHHKTYEHQYNELEHLDDLVLLCSKCHHRYKNIKHKKRNIFENWELQIKYKNDETTKEN